MARHPIFLPALVAGIGLSTLAPAATAQAVAPASTDLPPAASPASSIGVQPVDARRGRAADRSPLKITIESMSPSYLPARGEIEITGTVTNRDDVTWSDISLYTFLGNDVGLGPMTTSDDLADAVETDAAAYVGNRLVNVGEEPGEVSELVAGATSSYKTTVPVEALEVTEAGVYWFGVHALGQSELTGRDRFTDGRARTFLPVVPSRTDAVVDTALVVSLRRRLAHDEDGSLSDLRGWTNVLDSGGQLRNQVDFGAASGSRPITWLLDPALPDAVNRLATGNPSRTIAPSNPTTPEETDGTEPPSTEPAASGDGAVSDALAELGPVALDWLAATPDAMSGGDEVLTLPYGDPDLAATTRHDPDLLTLAQTQSSAVVDSWGFETGSAVGAPNGFLDQASIEGTDPDSVVLVSDDMFPLPVSGGADAGEHRLSIFSSGAATGGPGPGPTLSPVALRQRILAEAAVRLLDPDRPALIVPLPTRVDPAGAEEFYGGLDAPWLNLTSVSGASSTPDTDIDLDDVAYPTNQLEREIDGQTFETIDSLISAGDSLQNLLSANTEIGAVVTEQALSSASYGVRNSPTAGRVELDSSLDWLEERLGAVQISAPPGVTLSSAAGSFPTTVTNDLDESVSVTIEAISDDGIVVTRPEPVTLGPRSRTTVLLEATATSNRVHNVTLQVTDVAGRPLGSSTALPIRSAQVSNVIWVLIGTGAGLLFFAILVRLFRRIRGSSTGNGTGYQGAEPA